jgi:hypothetical protein
MEAWMQYDNMLYEVFQQLGAYPYPFGSSSLGWVEEASDEQLRRLSWGRLRDQGVSVPSRIHTWMVLCETRSSLATSSVV